MSSSMMECHNIGPCVSYSIDRPKLELECVTKAEASKEILLIGPRGNGKTQLARKVARQIVQRGAAISVDEVRGSCIQQMNALREKCGRNNGMPDSKVVIIDGVNQYTQHVLNELKRERPPQWIFIITMLDENLDWDNCIKVECLSEWEFQCLFHKLSRNKDEISDDLVKEFYEELEGNPLELIFAVEYVKRSKRKPEDYLKLLQDGRACMLSQENTLFKQNEYPSTLRTALTGDLHEVFRNLERFPHANEALQALAFFDNKNIPIEVFPAVFDVKNQYDVTDVLLEQVSTYSLGDISRDDNDRRILRLNKAFQRVLIFEMDEQTKQQSLELACKILVHLCHKDNRVKADYEAQIDIEPHVKSVLDKPFGKRSVGVTILKIWLLSTLGHHCIQTGQIDKGESTLEKAMKVIEKDLLEGKQKLLDLVETDLTKLSLRNEQLCHTGEEYRAVKEFVQSLRISSSDQSKWSSRYSELNKHFDDKVTSLTPELYDKLVENDCAIEIDRVVPYFLAEVVATVLYSYGRIFLYNQRDKERKQKALEVSKMICQSIEKTYKVRLLHTELVDRNGLLCFKLKTAEGEMKSQEMMQKDAEDAISGYEERLRSSCDRYEYGLLKSVRQEQYQKMVCMRYKLKAHRILWTVRTNDSDVKSKILDCVRQLDGIMSDGAAPTGNLQRNTSVETEIASTLLLLEDKEHLENAKDRFLRVCDAEKKCRKINYPWMEALEGLVTLAKIWQSRNRKKSLAIAECAEEELHSYIKKSSQTEEYADHAESANGHLATVHALLNKLRDQADDSATSSLKSACQSSISSNCVVGPTCSDISPNVLKVNIVWDVPMLPTVIPSARPLWLRSCSQS